MRNIFLALILSLALPVTGFGAANSYPAKTAFQQVIYLSGTGTSGTGLNSGSPKGFADQDLWEIPANTVIEDVYFCIDTAITGTTVLEVGDDDDADGFVTDQAASFATPGCYSLNAKVAGAYLRVQTAGATDAADVYVVPAKKYYSAAGKEVKLNITTTNTAGKARVIIRGFFLGSNA
jgi:hypothetical protein